MVCGWTGSPLQCGRGDSKRFPSWRSWLGVQISYLHSSCHPENTSSVLDFSYEPGCQTSPMVMTNNPPTAEERRIPCIPPSHDR